MIAQTARGKKNQTTNFDELHKSRAPGKRNLAKGGGGKSGKKVTP